MPTNVVAQSSVAAGLWDAGYQVDGVYGELGDDPGSVFQRGNVDLSKVEKIGSTYGEFDVDAYAKLQPDLLIDYSFGGVLWYVPSKQEKQIEKLAPIIGVNGQPKDIDEAIGLFTDLAAKLGADTTCNEELNAAKETYQEGLKKVGESAGDLKVLIASAAEDSLYIVNPTDLPETQTFEQAGVDLIEAPDPDTGNVFTQLSWEKASEFADADVILLDGRNTEDVKKKLETIDTWANLPAVQAGQVYTWYAGAPYSYQSYTKILDELADDLAKSQDLG
ncbi:ABC transporter substrate-binding protein [Nocardioides humi]|uniref:ABC transporter substrate-binding protein n=1 Tax=Nocardioides humi TaxID=449461 RepID=UPI00112B0979|nr:ABC transporter substrate-binding protein [Nocardioides humi]